MSLLDETVFLTAPQMAEMLGIDARVVHRSIERGLLTPKGVNAKEEPLLTCEDAFWLHTYLEAKKTIAYAQRTQRVSFYFDVSRPGESQAVDILLGQGENTAIYLAKAIRFFECYKDLLPMPSVELSDQEKGLMAAFYASLQKHRMRPSKTGKSALSSGCTGKTASLSSKKKPAKPKVSSLSKKEEDKGPSAKKQPLSQKAEPVSKQPELPDKKKASDGPKPNTPVVKTVDDLPALSERQKAGLDAFFRDWT